MTNMNPHDRVISCPTAFYYLIYGEVLLTIGHSWKVEFLGCFVMVILSFWHGDSILNTSKLTIIVTFTPQLIKSFPVIFVPKKNLTKYLLWLISGINLLSLWYHDKYVVAWYELSCFLNDMPWSWALIFWGICTQFIITFTFTVHIMSFT